MNTFTHRKPSELEQWASCYESFVASITEGYGMSIYEYANDVSCRQCIEEIKTSPEALKIWPRIEIADQALKRMLLPTKRCIHGDYPESNFWYWGYPPNSPELESDLKSLAAI